MLESLQRVLLAHNACVVLHGEVSTVFKHCFLGALRSLNGIGILHGALGTFEQHDALCMLYPISAELANQELSAFCGVKTWRLLYQVGRSLALFPT